MSLEASVPKAPKKHSDFLSARLYTSGQVMRLLRAGADLHGYPSEDHLATELLLKALDAMPEVAELANTQAKAAQAAREAYLSAHPTP